MQLTDNEIAKVRSFWAGRTDFLGKPDAEKDSSALPNWLQLLVNTPDFLRVVRGDARLVVGRKGCGKSAGRVAAEQLTEDDARRAVLSASADDMLSDSFAEFRQQFDQGIGAVQAWYKGFAYEMLKKIAENMAGVPLTGEAELAVRRWALESGFVERDFGERFVQGARSILPQVREHLHEGLAPKLADVHINKLLNGRHFTLYVDDFDNVYRPRVKGLSADHIRAAIEAADRLSTSFNGPKITLLLREDLWLICRHQWHYLDKLEGTVDLRWREDELRTWVEHRLRLSVAIALDWELPKAAKLRFANLWPIYFPEFVDLEDRTSSASFGYILRRTLYTPRDLRSFLARIGAEAKQWPSGQKQIEDAEERYSQDRLVYLANEFGSLCDGLTQCLFSFSGHPMEWGASELQKHLRGLIGNGNVKLSDAILSGDSAMDLARFLVRIGFLEVRYPQGDRWERRDAMAYPDHWLGIRSDDAVKWAVRSSFFRVLRAHGSAGPFDRARMSRLEFE